MRPRSRALLVACAAALVAAGCSASDSTGPLYPGGTTPPAPTTHPGTTGPATSEPSTSAAGSSTTAAATTAPTTTTPGAVSVPPADHPLDALTPDELSTFRDVLKADGKLDGSQFPYVALDEPDKNFVLSWTPGQSFPRRAFAVVRRADTTYEAVVDLTARKVVSWTEKPGAQPGFLSSEFSVAVAAARSDARFKAGMQARNIAINDAICLVFAGGSARGPEEVGHRLGRVTCYLRGTDQDYFARPIEGLVATVDVQTGQVLSVTDTGAVEVPSTPAVPDPQRQRPPLTPVGFATSGTPNVHVDGYGVDWAGWSFQWRGDRRAGVELADVRFDAGDGAKRVMYEGYVSDLFVPYQDPDPAWAFRTLLDSAEFGLGTTLSSLKLGTDCPDSAILLDVVIPDDNANAGLKRGAACVFERPTGDPAWRHQGNNSDPLGRGAPEVELVLRWISTIGNYDYIVDDVFGADGSMRFHVYAAGIVLQKGVAAASAADAHAAGVDAHGVLVGDGLVATNHDHYLSFRLDLDAGGQSANRMVRQKLVPETVTGDPGRTQVWKLDEQVVGSEQGALYTPDPQQPERILFESSTADGPAGHNPGYELDFGDAVAVSPVDATADPGMRRGGWAAHTVWVTPYSPDERFASGTYVPDGTQQAGLPVWTAQDRPLTDTDLVLWFTVGFHHIVRTEDLPTMPAHEAQFGLRPADMYPYNPFLDISRS